MGDTNGDGYDDVLVAAVGSGEAYLLRGPYSGAVDLPSQSTLRYTGDIHDDYSVANAGDTDGDGIHDMLIPGEDGPPMLFSGDTTGDVVAADADAVVMWMDSSTARDPKSAGDVNADGYGDLVIDDDGESPGGVAFIAIGPFSGDVDVGTSEAKLVGEAHSCTACAVDGAGDVNGDGFADVMVGARESYADGPGSAYLVYGPISGTWSLTGADVQLVGGADDEAGRVLAGGGDVDADGIPDLLIGSGADTDGGTDAGATWVVLGSQLLP